MSPFNDIPTWNLQEMLENSNDVNRPAYKHTRVAYISISDFLAVQKGGGKKDKEGGGVCKHNM